MEREKKLVSLCLCILFIAFIVVYSLLYQVKGQELLAKMQADLEKKTIQTGTIQMSTGETQIFSLELDKVNTGSSTAELTSGVNNSNIVTTGVDAKPVVEEQNQNASTDDASNPQEQEFLMLSGTDLYFGVVDSFEKLGLNPEYILKDRREIYYAFFDKEPTDLKKIVQKLGGNIYVMATESEILKNELFGNKISYINLPEYKTKLVVLLLEVDQKYRLLQIPYSKYHTSKSYLKTLFI
ncbi:MAG: hypothetical protein HG439_001780 [candidate division SR1 bacterium]|nr:hypothetical protein [candidate division SR1 bacterium]